MPTLARNHEKTSFGREVNIFARTVTRQRGDLPPVRVRADGVLVLTAGVDFRAPGQRDPYQVGR